ncbi:Asp-tRNA(Asn)/Glu-tRNA(Gln) amidotransferase subunit GatA [Thiohalorhabdus methylotrophus]|uniref:Glutamyl-tRNA(Gln) amidotransferase subunit A n=1 Tax=Thiohalorhabdus methylotrophus TaxID=3242694 RepID=A0ABV4U1B8_9GAMM
MVRELTLSRIRQGLRNKEFSSREVTQAYLDRIEELDPRLNSFTQSFRDAALAAADAADRRIAAGEARPLEGVPIAHKDLLATVEGRTTCASRMLESYQSPFDATVVERLGEAGAVVLGKTNLDELAMGSSNETSYFGPVRNPWSTDAVPGGSSGGSGASVAARLCAGATGTDTGGSIRQPAGLCGITGLKPTYGRCSRYGLVAFASSLDQPGPMALTAEDCAHMLTAMAGFDERDSTSVDRPVNDYVGGLEADFSGKVIGVPAEFFTEGLAPDVERAVKAALDQYRALGAEVREIHLPHYPYSIPTYQVISAAEASSNLARFDGVRYTHRTAEPENLIDMYQSTRAEGFGAEVQRRIMVGTFVLSAGYYDAYYLKAQKVRTRIRDDFAKAFEEVDLIAGPTSPTAAFGIGEKATDPIAMYLSDLYTTAANLAGVPGISFPCGFSEGGLPVGMHMMANFFREDLLLNAAHQYQQATDWHTRIPEGF